MEKNIISLEGKVALITGAEGGIGSAAAKRLADAGAKVMLTDLNEEGGKAVKQEIQNAGGDAVFLKHDVTSETEWKDIVQKTVDIFGGLDILFNCPATNKGDWIHALSGEDFLNIMRINLMSQMLGDKYAILAMEPGGIAGKGGSIINMSSTGATRPSPGSAGYCVSKAAILMLTRCAAAECGERKTNIRVNSIIAATVNTDFPAQHVRNLIAAEKITEEQGQYFVDHLFDGMPFGAIESEDVANTVLFLASDASSKITGTEITIDSGTTGN